MFKLTKKKSTCVISILTQLKLKFKQIRFVFIRNLFVSPCIYARCNSRRRIPGFKGHEVPVDFATVHIRFNNLISENMLKEHLHVFPEASYDEYADATYVIILRCWNKIIHSSRALNLFLDTSRGRMDEVKVGWRDKGQTRDGEANSTLPRAHVGTPKPQQSRATALLLFYQLLLFQLSLLFSPRPGYPKK